MTKKTILGLCLTAMVAGISMQGYAQEKLSVDKIVANVGNSAILYSEVVETAQQLTEMYLQEGHTSDRDPFYEALELLLEQKLAYNQAQIDSLTIDESMVSSYVDDMVRAQVEQVGTVKELENMHHMTIYDLRKDLSNRVRVTLFKQTMERNVKGNIKITPGEVESFYKSLPADSIPIVPEQYVYAHIVRFPAKMEQAKQRVRETLLDMREQVINGTANFETLARLYSIDGSAAQGGELPPFTKNQMIEPFATAAAKLKPGQVSEVVETENGFHIIQMIDKMGDRYHVRHILMQPQYTRDELVEGSIFLDSLANVIREGKITFEKAALQNSEDATTRMNGGIVNNIDLLQALRPGQVNASETSFKFKREDFGNNTQDYNVIRTMNEGDISDSFYAHDLRGNALSKIIKLVKVYPTHPANLQDDYLELEAYALMDKQNKEYQKWLKKTIDATFIRIDPAYRKPEMFVNKMWIK